MQRIDTVVPGMTAELAALEPTRQREIARMAAGLALARHPLEEHLGSAVIDLAHGKLGPSERARIVELTRALDDEYWGLEPASDAEAHTPFSKARSEAFERARTADALAAALDDDPLAAATNAMYEAWAALGSGDEAVRALIDIVRNGGRDEIDLSILEAGTVDYLDVWYMSSIIEDVLVTTEHEAVMRETVAAIERLLSIGRLEAGRLVPPGEFEPWPVSDARAAPEIRRAVEALGDRPPQVGEIAWFRVVPEGG